MNKNVEDMMERRRRNLALLKEQTRDEWQTLAKRLATTKSWLSQLSTGHRPFTERTARGFEKKLSLSPGFFDTEQISNSRPTSQNADKGLLPRVIAGIDSALKATGKAEIADSSQYGRLVEFVYEDSVERGMPSHEWLVRLLKLILD